MHIHPHPNFPHFLIIVSTSSKPKKNNKLKPLPTPTSPTSPPHPHLHPSSWAYAVPRCLSSAPPGIAGRWGPDQSRSWPLSGDSNLVRPARWPLEMAVTMAGWLGRIVPVVNMGVSENSVPLFTQWFCWSLSLLNGYFIGNIPYFQTNPYVVNM